MRNYVIGIDLGTLSGRAALVDAADGRILATAVYHYPHGVMDAALPTGEKLPPDWALQHPQDHLDVLLHTIPALLRESGADPAQVKAIALDVTSATVMPVRRDGTPLCLLPEYARQPHAWMKLWKHHAAQRQADRMTAVARARGEAFLSRYGGKVSSEWSLPKLLQVLEEAPELYAAMDAWVESTDWLVWQLTGVHTQNACSAGYKCFYESGENGASGTFPTEAYFAAVGEGFRHVVQEKLHAPVVPNGVRVGGLTDGMARRLGLLPGTAVAAGNVDAHAAALAAGLNQPGRMAAIIGTSACHMLLGREDVPVPGVCGMVRDGILPGFWGYEAGQTAVGDHYAWLTERFVSPGYHDEARARGISLHQHMTDLAAALQPGQSGLLALDWWNGNRSILNDAELSGLLIGMTLQTRPEEVYRALLEATAFGTREIVDNYRACGVPVDELYALGGVSRKNPLAMQTLADVLNMPVHVADAPESGALGSAILAAACCGLYPSAAEASRAMAAPVLQVFLPDAARAQVYEQLYQAYHHLHELFGKTDDTMKRLRALRKACSP